jgi:hypothetical protein
MRDFLFKSRGLIGMGLMFSAVACATPDKDRRDAVGATLQALETAESDSSEDSSREWTWAYADDNTIVKTSRPHWVYVGFHETICLETSVTLRKNNIDCHQQCSSHSWGTTTARVVQSCRPADEVDWSLVGPRAQFVNLPDGWYYVLYAERRDGRLRRECRHVCRNASGVFSPCGSNVTHYTTDWELEEPDPDNDFSIPHNDFTVRVTPWQSLESCREFEARVSGEFPWSRRQTWLGSATCWDWREEAPVLRRVDDAECENSPPGAVSEEAEPMPDQPLLQSPSFVLAD